MRLPNTAHTSGPWRIHELTRDFRHEDVWGPPAPSGLDFDALGNAYMAAIRPFRNLIVYPAMMRKGEREWRAHPGKPTQAHAE